MRLLTTGLAAGLLLAACAGPSEPDPAGPTAAALPDPGLDLGDPDLALGAPIQVEDLVVWPVLRVADAARPRAELARFVPLDDALRAGDARVLEKGDVNQLVIINDGALPVLCLSGEVLEGGQQDRIVARDVVIEPGQTADLASFCVEQGRWHAEAGDESAGRAFRSASLFVSGGVKAAAQVSNDQGAVWQNVSRVQHANAVSSDTGAYLALRDSERVRAQVDERAGALLAELAKVEGAVGLVAAFDLGQEDEFVTGEVFGDAALCAAYRDKLVRAYALDAISRAGEVAPAAEPELRSLGYAGQSMEYFQGFDAEVLASGGLFRGRSGPAPAAGVRVTEDVIEAAGDDLQHLHRTLYKRRASTDQEQ